LCGQKVTAERLDTGRVAQVQAEELEPISPVLEVVLIPVPRGGVAREPRRDQESRPGAQQFQTGLVADFDPPASQEGDAPAEIGQFRALTEVQVGAGRTKLVVERVNDGELPLADVAALRLDRLTRCEVALCMALLDLRR